MNKKISGVTTIIGERKKEFLNMETGERLLADQIFKKIADKKEFLKCYLIDLLLILGIVDSKQADVVVYIAENTNTSNNLFVGTYKKIAEATGISEPTISKTLKKLQENELIKKIQNGVWLVNPSLVINESIAKKQIILSYSKQE